MTDFANWVMPFPDYFSMGPNIQFYIEHGVTGVYQEGQYMAYGGDLQVRSPKFTVEFSQSSYILMTYRVVGTRRG